MHNFRNLAALTLALTVSVSSAHAQEDGVQLRKHFRTYADVYAEYQQNPSPENLSALEAARAVLVEGCNVLGEPSFEVCIQSRIPDRLRFDGDIGPIAPVMNEAPVSEPVETVVEQPEPEPEPEMMQEEELPQVSSEGEILVNRDGEVVEVPEVDEPEVMVEPEPEVMTEPGPEVVAEPKPETVEEIPAEEAPVLDSQKEEPVADGDQPMEDDVPVDYTPAPTSDEEAQSADILEEPIESVDTEEGEEIVGEQIVEIVREQLSNTPRNAEVVERSDTDFRVVLQINNQLVIRNRDDERMQYDANDTLEEQLPGGRTRITVFRNDGTRLVTVYNRNGDILRRSLILADGSERVLVYTPPEREDDLLEWVDPADELPPLRLSIPLNEYVLDVANSDTQQVTRFLDQPPVEQIQRLYSVDEVKRSARIRDTVRRLEISDLTFDSGSANLGTNELGSLERVALAMHQMLQENPAETFLIEGHTDAVGTDLFNLRLSDLRAEVVAVALTQLFGIPPENLATQGYGERYLKVRTELAERANRRVTIKRITPLVSPLG